MKVDVSTEEAEGSMIAILDRLELTSRKKTKLHYDELNYKIVIHKGSWYSRKSA